MKQEDEEFPKGAFAGAFAGVFATALFFLICELSCSIGISEGKSHVWQQGEAAGYVERHGYNKEWRWKKPTPEVTPNAK